MQNNKTRTEKDDYRNEGREFLVQLATGQVSPTMLLLDCYFYVGLLIAGLSRSERDVAPSQGRARQEKAREKSVIKIRKRLMCTKRRKNQRFLSHPDLMRADLRVSINSTKLACDD